MVRVTKFFAYFSFFIVMLYIFFPKANLYYKAQEILIKHKVMLLQEDVEEKLFSLQLHHADVLFEGVEAAKVKEADILLLGFYNSVVFKDVKLSNIAKSFVPQYIKRVFIEYSVLHPLQIQVKIVGDFGVANGYLSIKEKRIDLLLYPSALMKKSFASSLRGLKKKKNGAYSYEKTF